MIYLKTPRQKDTSVTLWAWVCCLYCELYIRIHVMKLFVQIGFYVFVMSPSFLEPYAQLKLNIFSCCAVPATCCLVLEIWRLSRHVFYFHLIDSLNCIHIHNELYFQVWEVFHKHLEGHNADFGNIFIRQIWLLLLIFFDIWTTTVLCWIDFFKSIRIWYRLKWKHWRVKFTFKSHSQKGYWDNHISDWMKENSV